MSYTPGPWKMASFEKGNSRVYSDAGTVADIFEQFEQGERDARLIAASPDLLAALERLTAIASIDLDQSATYDGITNCEAIAIARSAIKKARGEGRVYRACDQRRD